MSIEKMREEFEAAYAKDYELVRNVVLKAEDIASMREGEHYGVSRGYLNGCWWGWQASRAALVIELPEGLTLEEVHFGTKPDPEHERWLTRPGAIKAIEAAGVKVKP